MQRYIDADKLKEHYSWWDNGSEEYREFKKKFDTIIDVQPTADVVPVVRCKDCRWFDLTDPCGTLTPNAHRCKRVTRLWMEDDAFCAYGKRREENAEIR